METSRWSFQWFFFFFDRSLACGVPGPGIEFKLKLQTRLQLQQPGSFNLLCPAVDQTCILVLERHHQSRCATVGIPRSYFLNDNILIVKNLTNSEKLEEKQHPTPHQSEMTITNNLVESFSFPYVFWASLKQNWEIPYTV